MKLIITNLLSLFLLLAFAPCSGQTTETTKEEIPHYLRKDNFTVLRVIIVNSKNEVLMVNDAGYWGMPWANLTKRQFVKESIDSMAMEYGIELGDLEIRGQFCFKYDYKPNVTFRNYYVAQYTSGEAKIPKNTIESKFEKVEWVEMQEAIERIGNSGMVKITRQILTKPDTVWGASFMVSHTDKDHPTKLVEDFYPLFNRKK